MKRSVLVLSVCGLSLVGCSSPEQQFIRAAKNAAMAKLRDPESARFPAEPYVVRTKGTGDMAKYDIVSACGIIDGKNGFGGYSGGTRFVAWTAAFPGKDPDTDVYVIFDPAPEKASAYGLRESPFDSITWNTHCVDTGHAPMKTEGL